MSLSARIDLEPSPAVARGEMLFPLLGLLLSTATMVDRWPMHRLGLLVSAAVVFAAMAAWAAQRLRSTRRRYRLTLSDRAEIDLWCPTRPAVDGSARLVESTVVWPGLWMIALRSANSAGVVRLPVLPSGLQDEARWPLARFLVWSIRARGGRHDEREKAGV